MRTGKGPPPHRLRADAGRAEIGLCLALIELTRRISRTSARSSSSRSSLSSSLFSLQAARAPPAAFNALARAVSRSIFSSNSAKLRTVSAFAAISTFCFSSSVSRFRVCISSSFSAAPPRARASRPPPSLRSSRAVRAISTCLCRRIARRACCFSASSSSRSPLRPPASAALSCGTPPSSSCARWLDAYLRDVLVFRPRALRRPLKRGASAQLVSQNARLFLGAHGSLFLARVALLQRKKTRLVRQCPSAAERVQFFPTTRLPPRARDARAPPLFLRAEPPASPEPSLALGASTRQQTLVLLLLLHLGEARRTVASTRAFSASRARPRAAPAPASPRSPRGAARRSGSPPPSPPPVLARRRATTRSSSSSRGDAADARRRRRWGGAARRSAWRGDDIECWGVTTSPNREGVVRGGHGARATGLRTRREKAARRHQPGVATPERAARPRPEPGNAPPALFSAATCCTRALVPLPLDPHVLGAEPGLANDSGSLGTSGRPHPRSRQTRNDRGDVRMARRCPRRAVRQVVHRDLPERQPARGRGPTPALGERGGTVRWVPRGLSKKGGTRRALSGIGWMIEPGRTRGSHPPRPSRGCRREGAVPDLRSPGELEHAVSVPPCLAGGCAPGLIITTEFEPVRDAHSWAGEETRGRSTRARARARYA